MHVIFVLLKLSAANPHIFLHMKRAWKHQIFKFKLKILNEIPALIANLSKFRMKKFSVSLRHFPRIGFGQELT